MHTDRPVCDNRTVGHSKIAVSASSASIVDCFLDANPAATQVYWISSRQGHQAKLDPSHYTLMDGFSRLSYKPDRCLVTHCHCHMFSILSADMNGIKQYLALQVRNTICRESEYGELLCYGANNVGTQREPCVFSIEAAGNLNKD